ncbi:MAG: hypothetical protein ACHQNA_10060 [Acidimicrobiales bacterium]
MAGAATDDPLGRVDPFHPRDGLGADEPQFLHTGSMGRTLLGGTDDDSAARALLAVRDALAPHLADDGVRLGAAVWCVPATA